MLELKYFVLKPRCSDVNDFEKLAHARASRKAIRSYARAIEYSDMSLATELRKWVDGIWLEERDSLERLTDTSKDRYDEYEV